MSDEDSDQKHRHRLYTGKKKRLSIDKVKSLTIKEDGIQFLQYPLFTPEQCKIIWNEVSAYMDKMNNSIDPSMRAYNGYRCYNINNIFKYGGLPTIVFLVMLEMAKLLSIELFQTKLSEILCSIEPFYFQKESDKLNYENINNKQSRLYTNKQSNFNIVHSFVQITSGGVDKSCFIARPKSQDTMVIFDNDEIPSGQVVLYSSSIIDGICHSIKSNRLVFHITCYQRPSMNHKTDYNIVTHQSINDISKIFLLNELSDINLQFPKLGFYQDLSSRTRDIVKSMLRNLLFTRYPNLDTDELVRLFGFSDLTDFSLRKRELYVTCRYKHIFDPIDIDVMRKKLFGSIDPSQFIVQTSLVFPKEEEMPTTTKKRTIDDTDNLSMTTNQCYKIPYKKQLLVNSQVLILVSSTIIKGLVLFQNMTGINIFTSFLNDIYDSLNLDSAKYSMSQINNWNDIKMPISIINDPNNNGLKIVIESTAIVNNIRTKRIYSIDCSNDIQKMMEIAFTTAYSIINKHNNNNQRTMEHKIIITGDFSSHWNDYREIRIKPLVDVFYLTLHLNTMGSIYSPNEIKYIMVVENVSDLQIINNLIKPIIYLKGYVPKFLIHSFLTRTKEFDFFDQYKDKIDYKIFKYNE